MPLQTQIPPVRGKAVHHGPVAFRLATIARAPCTSLPHPIPASPASRADRQMMPVPLGQTHTHLEYLPLISSISCLSRLLLHFHHDRTPSKLFARALTLSKAFRTDLLPPRKPFVRLSPKLLKLSVPCFLPTSVRLESRLYPLRLWVLQERR